MKKSIWLIIAAAFAICAIVIVGVAVSCGGSSNEGTLPPVASGSVVVTPEAAIPTGVEPSIRGYITRITYSAESTEILVESLGASDDTTSAAYDKALVKIDANTAIAKENGVAIDIASLALGKYVEVWFSDPTAESNPPFAYGQAIRVLSKVGGITGISRIPTLSVTGSSNSLAVVTYADWQGEEHEFDPVRKQLENTLGAHISANPGDALALNFSKQPDEVVAFYSSSPMTPGAELEIGEDGKIIIPENARGSIYVRVTAQWEGDSVSYAFAVSIIEQK
ncbi:MAG: hypothetical protein IJP17_01445 [Clostridia bacterium]|nr:hypothetical protein [Clostridia bacterium]